MNCCKEKPVITLQHGEVCKNHFLRYFEEKVFKTINKFKLLDREERLCVATSGGKDSLTVLYLTKKYVQKYKHKSEIFALAIDEGIKGYRKKTLEDLQLFCKEHEVNLSIVKTKDEFGKGLDDAYPIINKGTKKKPCNVCGVWRRYLLNKHARKLKATKVVTGHNLDDEAQAVMMNIFKANTKLAGRLGPKTGIEQQDFFIQRVKPLYFCSEKEVRLYTLLKGFKVLYTECPYSKEGYRFHIQELINDMENKYKGTKQGIVNSFLDLLPLMKEREAGQSEKIKACKSCSEAANNQEVCNACQMKEVLNAVQ
jgi:tRNA-5-methyluridine54 2-sulfurtransferase